MQDATHDEAPLIDEPWRSPLDELERTLNEVGRALSALRKSLESGGASPLTIARPSEPVGVEPEATAKDEAPPAGFESVWQRIKSVRQKSEAGGPDTEDSAEGRGSSEPPALESDDNLNDEAQAVGKSLESSGASPLTIARPSEPIGVEPEAAPDDEAPPAGFESVWQRIKSVRQKSEAGGPDTADSAEGRGSSEPPALESDDNLNDEAQAVGKSRLSSFEGVWERLERERKERSEADIEDIAEVRGLEHLPQTYRITVEDRDGTPVDLVPVHRALLTFAPADNISLVNFANGVPIVSVQMEGELDLERLAAAIGAATSRHCEVIQQEKGKLFLRLSSEEGIEG